MISRTDAFNIVDSHIQNKNLVKHCIAVEAAMRALARHFKQDEELWGIIGLLHDADWEATANNPVEHTRKTVEWLQEQGEQNETIIRTILAHNYEYNNEAPPQTTLEWSLSCCDELTGLITAAVLITPEKKIENITVQSVLKKFKSKNFAAAINREHIVLCEEKLGIPLPEFTQIVIDGMKVYANELGL